MRSVSASIIVAAGMLCFTAGAFIRHGDTQIFVMLVGGAVAAVALLSWLAANKDRDT